MADLMGGVDSNIPLQAKAPAPIDPMALIGNFANVQNALNQAKLFPTIQQNAQVGLAKNNNAAVYGSMAPFLDGPITLDRITQHLGGLEGSGLMTHPVLQEILALPGAPNSPQWQAALKTMIASRSQTDPGAMIGQVVGAPVDQNTGQLLVSGVRAPTRLGGGVSLSSGTQIVPSPDSLMTPQTVKVTPEIAQQYGLPASMIGQDFPIPRGQTTSYRGIDIVNQGDGRGNQIVPRFDATTGNPLTYSTTPPPMPLGARPASPANPGGAPKGTFMGIPPSGMATGTVADIEQNRQAYRNAQTAAAAIPFNNTQFIEAHDAISRLQNAVAGTGAGQAAMAQARRVLDNLGVANSQNVNDAATAEKLLNAAIAAKAPRSDAQQALAEHSNPNMNMPAGASLPIIRQLVGANRAQQLALETAPDKEGRGFISHNEDRSRLFNSEEGLRALSFDMMPAAQRNEYVVHLKDMAAKGNSGPWKRFSEVLTLAHEKKLVSP